MTMGNSLINTIVRTIAVYLLALLLTRLMGRKLVPQMTFFDFVVAITMGSLSADAMINWADRGVSSIVALIVLTVLSISTAYIYIKSIKASKIINSEPVTLVQNGTIVEENMKNIRLNVDELLMKLREKNAFNLADVEFAIMETDGELSVLPKSYKMPVTASQMNIQTKDEGLMKDIIIDGELMEENLKSTGLDKNWLNAQLRNQNIKDISEVFYGGIIDNKTLHISRKSKNKHEAHGQYGIE